MSNDQTHSAAETDGEVAQQPTGRRNGLTLGLMLVFLVGSVLAGLFFFMGTGVAPPQGDVDRGADVIPTDNLDGDD